LKKQPVRNPPVHRIVIRLLSWILAVVLAPFKLVQAIRRAMTAASVTLLLILIVTLNIIWGYPWTGMFAACASMLVLGFAANRIFRPRLTVEMVTPLAAVAGEMVSIKVHVRNVGWLPALQCQLTIRLSDEFGAVESAATAPGLNGGSTGHQRVELPGLGSGQRFETNFVLKANRRGVHRLPPLVCVSTFPFHLFRVSKTYRGDQRITVTPRPLTRDDGDQAFELVHSIGAWTRRLLAGDSLEYTGSREYTVGMPVRRWDFASWARLGRPIVREFSATSIQEVELIVDTSRAVSSPDRRSAAGRLRRSKPVVDESLERLLSTAATVIGELTDLGIRIRLTVTGQESLQEAGAGRAEAQALPMLIRLATATRVDLGVAKACFEKHAGPGRATSLLVIRNDDPEKSGIELPARGVVLTVDDPAVPARTEPADAA